MLPGSAPSTTGVSRELDKMLGFGSASTAHPHVVPAPPGEADVWYGLRENGGAKEEEEEEEGENGAGEERAPLPPAGSLSSSFPASLPPPSSAAPPWPSATSRLATWVWQSRMTARGPSISIEVAEFDASWRRVARAELTLPGAAFNPHDFGVSPRHYVFFQGQTTFTMLPYVVGARGPAQCVKIGTGRMVVHVAPRGQSHPQHARPVALEADEGGFLIHHAACFEDAGTGEIVVWSSGWAPGELERLAEAAAGSAAASASAPPAAAGAEAGGAGGPTASPPSSSSSPFPSLRSLFSRPATKTDDSMLGSWKVVLAGDFDGIPHTSLQEHRIDLKKGRVSRRTLFDDQVSFFFFLFFLPRFFFSLSLSLSLLRPPLRSPLPLLLYRAFYSSLLFPSFSLSLSQTKKKTLTIILTGNGAPEDQPFARDARAALCLLHGGALARARQGRAAAGHRQARREDRGGDELVPREEVLLRGDRLCSRRRRRKRGRRAQRGRRGVFARDGLRRLARSELFGDFGRCRRLERAGGARVAQAPRASWAARGVVRPRDGGVLS